MHCKEKKNLKENLNFHLYSMLCHYWLLIFFFFPNRCDCDWQASMTVSDTCHWLIQNVFSCWILILDRFMMPMLRCSGSISTGTETVQENHKVVDAEDDNEDFCTHLGKQGERARVFQSPAVGTAAASGHFSLKHHCTNVVPLKWYWNEATVTAKDLWHCSS